MQDSKKVQTTKTANIKNSLGSPTNKFKATVSPKNSTNFGKSPGVPKSPKGQWKSEKSINTAVVK